MTSRLIVSEYQQTWRESPSTMNTIEAEMSIRFVVTSEGKSFETAYKSIAQSGPSTSITNIGIRQYFKKGQLSYVNYGDGDGEDNFFSTTKELEYKLIQKNGYYFINTTFHTPLTFEEHNTSDYPGHLVISYNMNGNHPGFRDSVGSDFKCTKEFSAPWANQWKIPVFNTTYTFRPLPSTSELEVYCIDEDKDNHNSRKRCCNSYSNSTSTSSDGQDCSMNVSSWKASINFPSLDRGSERSPEQPIFRWNNTKNNFECISNSRNSLHDPNVFYLLGGVCVCVFLGICGSFWCLYTKKRRQDNDQLVSDLNMMHDREFEREHGHGFLADEVGTYEDRNTLLESVVRVDQLPLVSRGASDEEISVAIRDYHQKHTYQEQYNSNTGTTCKTYDLSTNKIELRNKDPCTTQQLVAFSACVSCSICINDFNTYEKVRILPRCGHIFHDECIRKWLVVQKSKFCPLCQAEVVKEGV